MSDKLTKEDIEGRLFLLDQEREELQGDMRLNDMEYEELERQLGELSDGGS